MPKGKIKWISPRIGAGFIKSEEGEDVFFSFKALQGHDGQSIRRGQSVSFDILKKQKGLSRSAARVQIA